ncbi:G-type lectin S-receptor-like serine/threonine-protein kinase SD2-5 isoform X3 [Selaginella moellendorffii]|nr:G-type lectin S-receptor-like serine/threonine-protein kinase SD2-5 isoform X3 [Selaginella moellendorffii]XP_024537900.1 G-type lectin S-receptor-like serine/threonine-protein kinase SD2-5 isoform X3 [Selaginella moellendorffii]XP_024537905.1 G-type lectin S-receptor-like serine/threonine-protein kinase SD2-5 isoform X3 [Selaginella moellendorffii]|eukprot:XP_024537899.1 G-type lectin S-receptor-like serine/threonine-protein kinase SD2-5 isoform X3 [Selaginella moellendorffii]
MGDQRNSIPGSQIHRRAASSRNSECRYRQRFRLETMPRNHLHPGAPDGSCCGRVASAKHQCQRFWPARRVILWKSTHQAITPGSAIALEFWETVVHENAPFIRNYSLSHGWEVTNNNQLLELQGSQSNASYRLLQAGDSPLLSQSGRFGLAFFRFHNSAEFYFALVLGSSNNTNSGVCVWAANRDNPVTENATVRVTDQGALEVADWDGKVVWSSPGGVSEMELRDTGNFVLYNSTGGISWQSFDNPTDILLEGQVMVTKQRLISSANSSSLASGNIKMEVEPSGLIFFLSRDTRQPYLVWNLYNGNLPADETSINAPCPTYHTELEYSAGQLRLSYQPSTSNPSQLCSAPLTAVLGNSSDDWQYLKLENDGKLVPYTYNSGRASWEQGPPFMRNRLGGCLPMACESNSVCSGNAQCSCIVQDQSGHQEQTCPSPSSIPLVCNHEVEAENHHFLNVSGAGYFSNNYTKADRVSTLSECWSLCLANCSCSALFFNKRSSTCFFVDRMYGGLTRDPNFDGFLKLQNAELFVRKKPKDRTVLLGVSIAASVVLLSALGLVVLMIWKHRLDKVERALALALQGSAQKYTYKELEVATGNFASSLGKGGFGTVYEGTLADGRKVAVKRLENRNQSDRGFLAEMASLGRISHHNVVQLYGFCSEKNQLMLVYEYVVNGSLDKWLFEDRCLDWQSRRDIALGVAQGLAYLHEESRQLIIHLDIKPENVLLDDKFRPKLSDFGMAKLLKTRDVSQTVTDVRGTPGYLAPEWLLHSVATKKCDVYSYGMVLLELIGGRRNLSKLGGHGGEDCREAPMDEEEQALWWYFPAWVVARVSKREFLKVVDTRIRDSVDEDEVKSMLQVALWCIQDNPSQRPPMDTVVQMLEGRKEILEPPLFFRFALSSAGVLRFSSTNHLGGSVSVAMVAHQPSGPR